MTTDTHTPHRTPDQPPQPVRGWRHLGWPGVTDAVAAFLALTAGIVLVVLLTPKEALFPPDGSIHLVRAGATAAALAVLTLGACHEVSTLTVMWQPTAHEQRLWEARKALDWYGYLPAASDATVLDGIKAAAAERHRLQALLDWNGIARDDASMPAGLREADARDAAQAAAEIGNRDAVIDRLTADAAKVADEAIAAFLGARAQGATDQEAKAYAVIAAYGQARTTSELLGVPLAADSTGQAGG